MKRSVRGRRPRPAPPRVAAPPARAAKRRQGARPLSASAIGVDTGGTFTDFVALVEGRLVAFKLPSTPRRPERAVLAGLRRLGSSSQTPVRHGSTVATNALLERKGARVTLVTTAGFEDLLEIGRQERPDLYVLDPRRPEPLVPAARRIGVEERIGPAGEVRRPLTVRAVAAVRRAVRATRPESLAVCLLHAYAQPAHEARLARALARRGVPLTASSDLCPEVREFERLATTVVNAYLAPRVAGYIERLARARSGALEIVLSHGGTAPPSLATREPVRQLLSGPAAGLEAAHQVARTCGFRRAMTLDVGGTSTDCAFVAGSLPRARGRHIADLPIQLPLLDVQTVGAGGGSIARVDVGGLLHVGPESAGSVPGPACYGRGGPATVTDAMVVLGRIVGDTLAAGALALDRAAAARALAALARSVARDVHGAAAGVVAIAEAHMAAALRRVSVERGEDPRGSALVAFGGAGGLHACALADSLGCEAVLFPRHAGVLSALGALLGSARREKSRSLLIPAADRQALARVSAQLEEAVRKEFSAARRQEVAIEHWAEVRYRGQSHELSIPLRPDLEARFHREHARRYGFADRTAEIEVVTLEVRGALPGPRVRPAKDRIVRGSTAPAQVEVWHEGRKLRAAAYSRAALARAFTACGPALIVEEGATLWIAPGWRARLRASGTLVLSR